MASSSAGAGVSSAFPGSSEMHGSSILATMRTRVRSTLNDEDDERDGSPSPNSNGSPNDGDVSSLIGLGGRERDGIVSRADGDLLYKMHGSSLLATMRTRSRSGLNDEDDESSPSPSSNGSPNEGDVSNLIGLGGREGSGIGSQADGREVWLASGRSARKRARDLVHGREVGDHVSTQEIGSNFST